jgi:hypothetical protein
MSVTTAISLIADESPPNVPLWLPALFRLSGASRTKLAVLTNESARRSLGRISAEEAAKFHAETGILHLDLGAAPTSVELCQSFQQQIGPDILGDCLPNKMSLRLGKEEIFYLQGHRERLRTVGFQFTLWGYGSPAQQSKFVELAPSIPAFVTFRQETERIIGLVEVAFMVYT